LLSDLLADLVELDGSAKVELLLARRAARTRANLERRLASAGSLEERVRILAQAMDEFGYLVTYQKLNDSTFLVSQYHCPIRDVAATFPAACRLEVEMYRNLLGAEIERCCYLLAGDHRCCYIIRAGASGSA
jgi:predicted ArsR family transcriptional regulator